MLSTIEEKEYPKFLKFVKDELLLYPHIDANDIFNDVFLKALEDEKEIYAGDFRKMLRNEIYLLAHGRKGQLNDKVSLIYEKEYSCSACKETLPASAFYFVRRKTTGHMEVLPKCKECQRKYVYEREKKKRLENDINFIKGKRKANNSCIEKKKRQNESKFRNIARDNSKKWIEKEGNLEKARQRAKDHYWKNKSKVNTNNISSDTP